MMMFMPSRKVKGEKKVLAELQKLKDCGIPEENSFAFMFACCGRGRFNPTTNITFDLVVSTRQRTP